MYQRIRHIMGYILRCRHSRPLCWPYTYRTLPIPHKVGTAMCLCSPPMGSEQKELCTYPGLAWSICRQMLSLTLPAGRWWPGSGEGKTKMEDTWVEENSALLISASSQDCYMREEEKKKLLCWVFMYLQLFVIAALPILCNTNKKVILQWTVGEKFEMTWINTIYNS